MLLEYHHKFIRQNLGPSETSGKTLLELGCGHGGILRLLAARKQAPAMAYGIDINRENSHGPGWEIINADALRLPFEPNTFDLVYSIAVFEHLHNLTGVLRETYRVLRPKGRAIVHANPIWTGFRGHHYGPDLLGKKHARPIELPWAHLMLRPDELAYYLQSCEGFSASEAQKARDWIHLSTSLNRKGFADYHRAFDSCPLSLIDIQPGVALMDSPQGLAARYEKCRKRSNGLLAAHGLRDFLGKMSGQSPLVYKFTACLEKKAAGRP